jgi:Putative Na+/H+ antiporter
MNAATATTFPLPLEAYAGAAGAGLLDTLVARVQAQPFNLVASLIFILAVLHTFLAGKIQHVAHRFEERHANRLRASGRPVRLDEAGEVNFAAQMLHFLGEIEAIFGIWAVVLGVAIMVFKGLPTAIDYLAHTVNYTEAMFVVIVMAVAATRPVLTLAERLMRGVAALGRGTPAAWWLSILVVAPVLGSLITEPAAMTIGALLLAKQFYVVNPGMRLKYATLGLLFVNISVGGTFTHFAAPPVLMVAAPWHWGLAHMIGHFGWKAGVGIAGATSIYFLAFRAELRALKLPHESQSPTREESRAAIPAWVTLTHLGFLALVVAVAHYPVLFIGAFLFFVAFTQATVHHQTRIDLKSPLLVGFFLAGLVIHGGLQGWWIEPVLKSLAKTPLFLGATALTAFNDNAAITYLATLVPNFSDAMKYAVVAGAVAGGGLTVIANAPNPAGQAILKKYFPDGIAPLGLLAGAIVPTLVMALCFLWL